MAITAKMAFSTEELRFPASNEPIHAPPATGSANLRNITMCPEPLL